MHGIEAEKLHRALRSQMEVFSERKPLLHAARQLLRNNKAKAFQRRNAGCFNVPCGCDDSRRHVTQRQSGSMAVFLQLDDGHRRRTPRTWSGTT
jgi:hypothetical protein